MRLTPRRTETQRTNDPPATLTRLPPTTTTASAGVTVPNTLTFATAISEPLVGALTVRATVRGELVDPQPASASAITMDAATARVALPDMAKVLGSVIA